MAKGFTMNKVMILVNDVGEIQRSILDTFFVGELTKEKIDKFKNDVDSAISGSSELAKTNKVFNAFHMFFMTRLEYLVGHIVSTVLANVESPVFNSNDVSELNKLVGDIAQFLNYILIK